MSKIVVVKDKDYAPVGFLVCKVVDGQWDARSDNTKQTILVQSDWEFPRLAETFGWKHPHEWNYHFGCPTCQKTVSDIISDAYDFLMECSDDEKVVEDTGGYFPE